MADSQSQPEPGAPRMQLESITLENLNTFILNGNEVLKRLKHQILAASKQNDSQWEQRFLTAQATLIKPDTTIGVIGATGTGKSSILNALLDEETLVPTSCMQACTATIIELVWNESLEHDFIAEVFFVKTEAWRTDISAALKDAAAAPASLNDDNTEAGMAFKKITAVYPSITKQNIKRVTVDELMEAEHVQQLLNTTLQLNASNARDLHDLLSKYVEGKEKLRASFLENGHSVSAMVDSVEYWPMVRRVRIHLRSYALETGVVISDLPGVGDSNAARGTVAQKHLGKCANIWIVTPIARAVDDKVARNLLGESFKRQLRRDGVMSRVAFVCSKADELVINELRERLRLSPEFMQSVESINQERIEAQKGKESRENEIQSARTKISSLIRQLEETKTQRSDYMRLRKLARDGNAVYPLAPRRSKRTAGKQAESPQKQARILDYIFSQPSNAAAVQKDYDDGMESDESFKDAGNIGEDIEQDRTQPVMALPEIDDKLKDLREQDKNMKASKKNLYDQLEEHKLELKNLVMKLQKLNDKEWDVYLKGRNTYCRQTLRADFAHGIRELEDEEAELDDEEFDPDAIAEQTGQDDLQEDLPVFCVSSQGFQKLRGRLEGEKITTKFKGIKQTGIPELVIHCRKLGRDNLTTKFNAYAEGANQLITSVRFWLSGPSDSATSTTSYTMQEATKDMLAHISTLVEKTLSDINALIVERVIKIFEDGAKAAQEKALIIVDEWTDPDAAGLRYQTYRAVVRRGGAFAKQNRNLDFAEDLLKPLLTHIDGVWNNVFNERIPRRLEDLRRDLKNTVKQYTQSLDQNAEFLAVASKTAVMYRKQVSIFKAELVRSVDEIEGNIKSHQQETNRLFSGNVQEELKRICTALDNDSGKGVFARIKTGMHAGVAGIRERIFKESVQIVERRLTSGIEELTAKFVKDMSATCNKSRVDCRRLFAKKIRGGKSISAKHKAAIQEILDEAEQFFEPQATAPDHVEPNDTREDDGNQRELSLPVRSSVVRTFREDDELDLASVRKQDKYSYDEAGEADDDQDRSSLILSDDESDMERDANFKKDIPDWSP